ncbi:hypothetical protein HMPREF1146_2283 [Prevotella sp. MSX73]|nr:hypothetical protein HMPREF1146_2283 [Prevotella sp. MSX73]
MPARTIWEIVYSHKCFRHPLPTIRSYRPVRAGIKHRPYTPDKPFAFLNL